jgi:hypothetical protein
MLRHTRPLLEIYRAQGQLQDNLARRHILPMPRIVFTDQERRAYEQLEAYCRGLAAQMAHQDTPQSRSAVGFLLSFLRLHFATYGDPVFEAVLQQIEIFPLPDCVRRLEVELPDVPATVVGYAVVERDAEGQPHCRLVTSWHELATVRLDVTARLSEDDVGPLRQRLTAIARQEFAITQAVPRIEALNERAGHAQRLLGYLVARGLLWSRLQTGSAEALFWREVQDLEAICQGRDRLRVRHIPPALGRCLSGVLFDVDLPSIGDEGFVDAPQPLIQASLDAMCRLANGLKRRRADLATADVISRLDREIERLGSQLLGTASDLYSRG